MKVDQRRRAAAGQSASFAGRKKEVSIVRAQATRRRARAGCNRSALQSAHTRRATVLLAFATAGLLALPAAHPASKTFAGMNGRIALQGAERGGSEYATSNLYLDSPGVYGEFVQLTRGNQEHDANPAWSPNGQLIAFNSNRDAASALDFDIWLVRPDGSGLRRLTSGTAVDIDPTWSPDGRRIAFVSDRGGHLDIWTMTAGGTDLRPVTNDTARDEEPNWSPDGTRIAFSSYRDGNQEIYVATVDGLKVVRLTTNPARDRHPNWSPDGTRIAFDSQRSGNFDIYTIRRDGGALRRLTRSRAVDSRPAWSPDGRQIVYQNEDEAGARHLLWIHPDGANVDEYTSGGQWHTSPDWASIRAPDRCTTRATIFEDRIEMTEDEQNDVMCMLAGDDSAYSYAGNDILEGGAGSDTLDGGGDDDMLGGGPGNDVLLGRSGNDRLLGGSGDDELIGGPGRDRFSCGAGSDTVLADKDDTVSRDCETVASENGQTPG
jgi:tricorn protease-like protein